MSYTASLIDGTTVEIVDKVPGQARGNLLVDAEGNQYVASKHGDYITPLEVAELIEGTEAEVVQATASQPYEEPTPVANPELAKNDESPSNDKKDEIA